MIKIEDDYIYEQSIEDFIPKRHTSTGILMLFTITIMLSGMLLLAYCIPYPKTLRGETYIIDENKAIIFLPPTGTGAITKGMIVRLYLDNYPSNEYGYLSGVVVGFANKGMPSKNKLYSIIINLNTGLKTNTGTILNKKLYLQGYGEIIIKNQKLIEVLI